MAQRLRAHADRLTVDEPPLPAILREGRRRRAARVTSIAIAIAVIAGSMAGATALLLKTHLSTEQVAGPVNAVKITRIRVVGAGGAALQYGEGAAWLFGPNAIYRIDPRTNAIAKKALNAQPLWLAPGEGSVWVPVCPTSDPTSETGSNVCGGANLLRLDPHTLQVTATIPLPLPVTQYPYSAITVGDGFVWVASITEGKVMVVDPTANRVLRVMSVPCCIVAAGLGSLWLDTPQRLLRVRESDGAVQKRFVLGETFLLSITPTAVWTETADGPPGLIRIDPSTNTITATWRPPSFYEMDAHGKDVWLAETSPVDGAIHVIRLDKTTFHQVGEQTVIKPNPAPPNFAQLGLGLPSPFITVGGGSAWVWNFTDGELVRITPPGGA